MILIISSILFCSRMEMSTASYLVWRSSIIIGIFHSSDSGVFLYFIVCLIIWDERFSIGILHSREIFFKIEPKTVLQSLSVIAAKRFITGRSFFYQHVVETNKSAGHQDFWMCCLSHFLYEVSMCFTRQRIHRSYCYIILL